MASSTMAILRLLQARSCLPLVFATSLGNTFPSSVTGAAFVSSFSPLFRPNHLVARNKLRQDLFLKMSTSTSTAPAPASTDVIPGRPTWQQTMLRIRDPAKSIPFYTDLLGFTHIDTFDFPQYDFSLYFLTTLPEGETYTLTPGTQEAHDYLWSMEGVALELTHNYGTEKGDFKGYHAGNQERDGFGHIAVNTDDVYAACDKLEKAGCDFQKKPDEGRYVLRAVTVLVLESGSLDRIDACCC